MRLAEEEAIAAGEVTAYSSTTSEKKPIWKPLPMYSRKIESVILKRGTMEKLTKDFEMFIESRGVLSKIHTL